MPIGSLVAARPHIKNSLRLGFLFNGNPGGVPGISNITFNSLCNSIVIATTATAAVNLYDQVRVKSVEITATPAAGTYGCVKLSFPGVTVGASGDASFRSSVSDGVIPAHLKMKPPRDSQAAQWQPGSSAAVAFSLSSRVNGTTAMVAAVFVDLEFAMNEDLGALASGNALVAATIGQVYYRGMDGLPIATTTYYPQGVEYVA